MQTGSCFFPLQIYLREVLKKRERHAGRSGRLALIVSYPLHHLLKEVSMEMGVGFGAQLAGER